MRNSNVTAPGSMLLSLAAGAALLVADDVGNVIWRVFAEH